MVRSACSSSAARWCSSTRTAGIPRWASTQALNAIGWTSTVSKGGDADEALARLVAASTNGPVWVGPVEMGHLHHQPEMTGPIGADHYVVVLDVDDERVLIHDPQGYPYAEVPIGDFMTAWRAETIELRRSVHDADRLREGRRRQRRGRDPVDHPERDRLAVHAYGRRRCRRAASVTARRPNRVARDDRGGAGGRSARTPDLLRDPGRRAAAAATPPTACSLAGYRRAAGIAATQARLVGSMQHPMVTR